jgi:hypothetical protein
MAKKPRRNRHGGGEQQGVNAGLRNALVVRPWENTHGIWAVYFVEKVMTGEKLMLKRISLVDEMLGDAVAFYEHRLKIEEHLRQHLPKWLLRHHIVLHDKAWRSENGRYGFMIEQFVQGSFRFMDDAFTRLTFTDIAEAKRLVTYVVALFQVLYRHGVVHGDAHLGNLLIAPNNDQASGPPGAYKIVFIDWDWCHAAQLPFSPALADALRNMCHGFDAFDLPSSPCNPNVEVADFFCQYRAAVLLASGAGEPSAFADLSTFLYHMYVVFLCGDVKSQANPEFTQFVQALYDTSFAKDFDVNAISLRRST